MHQKWSSKKEFEDSLLNTEVWAYTILGSKEAESIWFNLMDIVLRRISLEESFRPSNDFIALVINNRALLDLMDYAKNYGSRLSYLVLGAFLMEFGSKMPSNLRELILEYSRWEYEEFQFVSETDKEIRKTYLLDFQEKIQHYHEGIGVSLPVVHLSKLIEQKFLKGDFTLIDCQKLDYSL